MYKCIISESKMRRKGTKKKWDIRKFFLMYIILSLVLVEDLYVRRGSLLREIDGM